MVTTPTRFLTPEDVANRALQHVGATYITTLGSGGDDTKQNDEVSRVYHKVRRAELRRNAWRFSIKKTRLFPMTTSMKLFVPSTWATGTTYVAGAVVVYNSSGSLQLYVAMNTTVGQTPGADTSVDVFGNQVWEEYFGPLVIDQWYAPTSSTPTTGISSTAYMVGDIVYRSSTTTGPISSSALATGGTGYAVGDTGTLTMTGASNDATYIVTTETGGVVTGYTLTSPGNLYPVSSDGTTEAASSATGGAQPGSGVGLTFNCVVQPAGTLTLWRSLTSNNSADPLAQSGEWLQLTYASLVAYNILYPLGAGPLSEDASQNVFILPYGYLKEAPQAPKAGSTSYLGAPSGRAYDDWVFEGNFFVSSEAYPITFRFVADTSNVASMDDMFCEGWAARIGMEVCEPLTQSAEKVKTCQGIYRVVMTEARVVNGIEEGPTEPPEDDYITARW